MFFLLLRSVLPFSSFIFPSSSSRSPTLCMASVPVSGPRCPRREHLWCVIPAALSSQQPSWALCSWGGGGQAQGVVSSVCWRERTPGLWNVGLKCSPEAKCAINLVQGILRAGPCSGHRSGAEGPQSTSHIPLISLLFPFRHHFPWMAAGERSCCSRGLREHPGCGLSVSRRRGCTYAHIHLVVPV